MSGRAAATIWALFAVVAAALALLGLAQWIDALASGRPILYGEGPVAHAAILFRDGNAYRETTGAVAANYPPLYLALTSLGEPLRTGRAVTILSTLAVSALIVWRARRAGPVVAGGLGLCWLALAPVAIWGAAVKPDVLAVALTLAGVLLLERAAAAAGHDDRWSAIAGGTLLATAVWAKPTALLPAAAVILWVVVRARPVGLRALMGVGAVVALEALDAIAIGAPDLWRHVVVWNQLSWSAEQTLLVGVLGAATIGILLVAGILAGALRGIAVAYLVGALAIAVLAGREGATINYLLDLAAAILFMLAGAPVERQRSGGIPVAAMVQLLIGVGLLTPYSILPGRAISTGAWGQPERSEVVRTLGPGDHLVEDSGLLIADGRTPVIDDLFLWSRLVQLGVVDPAPLLERARAGALASVVSEADLAHLDTAPAYERARWSPPLVSAILGRYRLERATGVLWVYRPR